MARIPDWLEALVKNSDSDGDNVENSMAAIQTAALMPELILEDCSRLGGIVLTAEGKRITPNPDAVFLGEEDSMSPAKLVHRQLQEDTETLVALEKLGIKSASAESAFRECAQTLLGSGIYETRTPSEAEWISFWKLAR